jgi:hypothetical protein
MRSLLLSAKRMKRNRDSRTGESEEVRKMNLRKKLLAGAFALAIGTSLAIPTTARADDWWHHDRDHHSWWAREHDHNRDYYLGHNDRYYNHPGYNYYPSGQRYLAPNGEGMINARNPNLYWACDADGHHCQWARR